VRGRAAQGEQERGSVTSQRLDRTPASAEPAAGEQPGHVPDAVFHLDDAWRFTFLNPAGEDLLARSPDQLLGRDFRQCLPTLRGTAVERAFAAVLADGAPLVFDHLHGPWDRWYEIRVVRSSTGLTVTVRDIDDRRRQSRREADQRRAETLRELTAMLEALPSATVLVDEDGRIRTLNRVWLANGELLRTRGIEPGTVGDNYVEALSRGLEPADAHTVAAGIAQLVAAPDDGTPRTFEHEYPCALDSGDHWWRLQASRVAGSRQVVVCHVDVTDQYRTEQALERQARTDELTDLPNRAALLELVGAALGREERGPVALLHLDLDGFKTVNDSLGHVVGDALLQQVAKRLAARIRPGDAVGRLSGDQFLVLAHDVDANEAASLAFRLQSAFAAPFAARGISVPLSASIGVAVAAPGDGSDAHGLVSDADSAMYAAKASGRERVHLFAPGLREAARWRLDVASRLRHGAVDQLVVHYQPVVRLDTGEVEGVEALVRWQHPERGLLPPDTFLSVAEETGQLIPITRWLLRETARQAAAWAQAGVRLRLAVNISARHFAAETLVRDVRLALHRSGLPAEQLMLELTETSLAEDPARAEAQLGVLRGMGVRVAIDDFGTGWSSLAQLLALPIGTLKIDRSLLTAAERVAAGDSGAVLAAIVALTRTLGIRSVAEGVETAEHLRLVREAGCDLVQGYLLGHPMPADQVLGWVRGVRAAGGDLCRLAAERADAQAAELAAELADVRADAAT
jgi:diguanylate cyclase (GGDEF)-like protein